MFVSGKIRGNAPQLADYLLAMGENERVFILDVDGRAHPNPGHLKDTLYGMELNSELTRSANSIYHAVIRPDPESQKDRALTMEEWHKAVEMLAEELPFQQQRRATVLHEKDGYFHAHVVFERYDHEKGTMIDYKHNYKAHDRARFKLEREFGHKITPNKNPNRDRHKKSLSEIWQQTKTGSEFIKEAKRYGYTIAKGTTRPFMVIDEQGRSFNLVKMLKDVKTKDVRERLADTQLKNDKSAIRQTRLVNDFKANNDNNTKPLNNKHMFFEINEEQKQERDIFEALGRKHLKEMEERHFKKAKKYGSFDKIPSDLLQEMKDERDAWQDKWGKKGEQSEKLHLRHDQDIDDELNEMYRDDLRGEFAKNEGQILNSDFNKKEAKKSWDITDVDLTEHRDDRRAFLKEMHDAQNRKQKGLEI
ncbi:relaxase/mobilization nuclease domain-containing protein [Mucilaginibacter calamicampi]|uniref:Relaxase/mobilization nuclease domain-containing protein n=1 Tax=Mucilaginibacter calamicampi TaxID=1302352 RepID=A0ABW2YYH5_9SPHI